MGGRETVLYRYHNLISSIIHSTELRTGAILFEFRFKAKTRQGLSHLRVHASRTGTNIYD